MSTGILLPLGSLHRLSLGRQGDVNVQQPSNGALALSAFPLYLSYHSFSPSIMFYTNGSFPSSFLTAAYSGFTTSNLYVRLGIYTSIGGFGLEASVHDQLNPV
jgi:hypothetical protein